MRKPRILIVDDDEMMIKLFEKGLGSEYDVVTAPDGEHALKRLGATVPDVVISDIRLPGMSGLDFLERARQVDPEVTVVFITAYRESTNLRRAVQLGAFDLVDKPFSLAGIRVVVERAFKHRRLLRSRRRLEVLSRGLNAVSSVEDLMGYLSDNMAASAGVRLFSLFLFDPEQGHLVLGATNHVPLPKGMTLTMDQVRGPMKRAIETGKAAFIEPSEREASRPDAEDRKERYGDDASVTLPLEIQDELVGVMNLNDKLDAPAHFDEADIAFLSIAAEHVASSIAVRREAASLATALKELKQTQAQLIQSEKLAALAKLIAGVAHELKNPIASLTLVAANLRHTLGKADLAEDIGKKADMFLGILDSDISRLGSKVDEFMSFARPTDSKPVRCAPVRVIGEGLLETSQRVAASRARLAFEHPAELPDITVDPSGLKEAVVNLVVNALEAIDEAGEGEQITVAVTAEDSQVVIKVSDDGPGIPESVKNHLFELFFTTRAKGSGIGLAQVHLFCDTHGGSVELEGSDQGTTFTLRLPTAGDPP